MPKIRGGKEKDRTNELFVQGIGRIAYASMINRE